MILAIFPLLALLATLTILKLLTLIALLRPRRHEPQSSWPVHDQSGDPVIR